RVLPVPAVPLRDDLPDRPGLPGPARMGPRPRPGVRTVVRGGPQALRGPGRGLAPPAARAGQRAREHRTAESLSPRGVRTGGRRGLARPVRVGRLAPPEDMP